jgi:hypothetical protein
MRFYFLKDVTIQILQDPDRFIETPALGGVLIFGYIPDEKNWTMSLTSRKSFWKKTGMAGMMNIIQETGVFLHG